MIEFSSVRPGPTPYPSKSPYGFPQSPSPDIDDSTYIWGGIPVEFIPVWTGIIAAVGDTGVDVVVGVVVVIELASVFASNVDACKIVAGCFVVGLSFILRKNLDAI